MIIQGTLSNQELCTFWNGQSCNFEILSQLAHSINTALPSSASIESVFSMAGSSSTSRRAKLSLESLDSETILKYNKNYIK